MKVVLLLSLSLLTSTLMADTKVTKKEEMEEMKRNHAQCLNSGKSSSNCHQEMMKACKLPQEECLKMMGRMDMEDVLKTKGN